MKAIIIDAKNKTLKEISMERGDTLRAMQSAVGGRIERATTLENGDDVFVDEEGMFNGADYGFQIQGAHQPFLGNGVVASCDNAGNTVAAKSTIEELGLLVKFFTLKGPL